MQHYKIYIALAAASLLVGCDSSDDSVSFDTPTFNQRGLHYTYPLDEQQQVAPNAPVVLRFSDEVTLDQDNFTFQDADENDVSFSLESVGEGRGVVLRPDSALDVASDYQLTLDEVIVAGEAVDFPDGTLNFTTRAALEGPTATQKTADQFAVESLFPGDDGLFQAMDFSSFRLRTTQPLVETSAVYGDTIKLTRDGEVVPALMLVGRSVITVDPKEDLEPGVSYELSISGLQGQLGGSIDDYAHTTTPQDTTSPKGERPVLVTEAPAANDCKNPVGESVSQLTGEAINCVPVIGTLLQDQTVSGQSGNIFGELAHTPNFPEVTPLRIKRGSVLTGDALEVFIGGEVPVGFDSGEVTVEVISDATGYLYPNPNSAADDAPKNLRLFMDASTSTTDARANGAFTQNLMHLELIGKGIIENGKLKADALTLVEPRVLGVENSYGMLSFRMESYVDQENAPEPVVDAQNPFVPMIDLGKGNELSWQPGNVADRMVPGEPIVIHFNEALDPTTISTGESLKLTRGGMPEPFSWTLNGNALVIQPDDPVSFGEPYDVTTTPEITDLAGNPLQMLDGLEGDNTLSFTLPSYVEEEGGEDVRRGPFATTVYPGFPCASSEATAADLADGWQGSCVSSSGESEQEEIDRLPIVALPSNRSVRVRFSQNMDPATINLGEACEDGSSFRVEKLDSDGECVEVMPGKLAVEPRALTFTPEQGWDASGDTLYRYVLGSSGGGSDCPQGAMCSTDQLPLQTAPLLGGELQEGGPDMAVVFKGRPAIDTIFQELGNLPRVDVNTNFQVDPGEPAVGPDFSREDGTPANAVFIDSRDGGGGGLVTSANTGCGYSGAPPYSEDDKVDCDNNKIMYVTGALNTEIIDYDEDEGGVPVIIYPTAVVLTNLDATAVVGLDLNVTNGDSTLDAIPILGPILSGVLDFTVGLLDSVVNTLASQSDDEGVLSGLLNVVGDLGLIPIDTATGPNIMRVRYEPQDPDDPNSPRTKPPVGYILPPLEEGGTPRFRITFDLLFDAPALSLPLGLEHNVKSLPIDDVVLEGPLDFLPDGRLFIGLTNESAQEVDLEISLADQESGKVKLEIPQGGINLSYQSVSIQ